MGRYISIHSPYTGRDPAGAGRSHASDISIHSPYTGRDGRVRRIKQRNWISIHSPYTGRDGSGSTYTLPSSDNFNPLSLYRERQIEIANAIITGIFQSTLPIQGETYRRGKGIEQLVFQSTLPIQGETSCINSFVPLGIFQSTLPIQGETLPWFHVLLFDGHFNPLSLYRERHN